MQSRSAFPTSSEPAAALRGRALPKAATDEVSIRFQAMACDAEILIQGGKLRSGSALLEAAVKEVRRIEAKYSRYRSDSVVSRINAAAGSGDAVGVDRETAGLLRFADQLYDLSEGLFDITSGVLRRAWDFRSGTLPVAESIDAILPRIGWQHVRQGMRADWRRIRLPLPGMELDFGGFGKEYAADRAATILQAAGVRHGFVIIGGDIRVIGPRTDGDGWTLGIQHPRHAVGTVAGVAMSHGALATSGDYERFMEIDGVRYCHILNPRTGQPVRHWQSVSVAAPVCVAAGAMTTIAMLMEQRAEQFLREQEAAYIAIDMSGRLIRKAL